MKRKARRKRGGTVLERACTSKVTYVTEASARMAARSTIWRSHGKIEAMWPYTCEFCQRWHLSTRPSGLPRVTAESMG